MPRLARWMFNALYAVALTGFDHRRPPLICCSRARPGTARFSLASREDYAMNGTTSSALPGSQAEIQLESARNRLKPFFDCPGLRAMFSSSTNSFDVAAWMRDKKVVIINLAPHGKLPEQSADTLGGPSSRNLQHRPLAAAGAAPGYARHPRRVSALCRPGFGILPGRVAAASDIAPAIHQSFSQLKQGEVDLTSLIFQAQHGWRSRSAASTPASLPRACRNDLRSDESQRRNLAPQPAVRRPSHHRFAEFKHQRAVCPAVERDTRCQDDAQRESRSSRRRCDRRGEELG